MLREIIQDGQGWHNVWYLAVDKQNRILGESPRRACPSCRRKTWLHLWGKVLKIPKCRHLCPLVAVWHSLDEFAAPNTRVWDISIAKGYTSQQLINQCSKVLFVRSGSLFWVCGWSASASQPRRSRLLMSHARLAFASQFEVGISDYTSKISESSQVFVMSSGNF